MDSAKKTLSMTLKVKQLLSKKELQGQLSETDQTKLDELLFQLDGIGAGAYFVELYRTTRLSGVRIF